MNELDNDLSDQAAGLAPAPGASFQLHAAAGAAFDHLVLPASNHESLTTAIVM